MNRINNNIISKLRKKELRNQQTLTQKSKCKTCLKYSLEMCQESCIYIN